jgi:uncharacterized protein (TIGR03067 family)
MRSVWLLVALLVVSLVRAEDPSRALSPAEAAKKVNEKVTVQMEVKAVGQGRDNSVIFLNSEKSFRDEGNFTVFINRSALAKFKEAKIDDPAEHFKGKTVQVTGKVVLYNDHPEIILAGPDAITIVGAGDPPKSGDAPKVADPPKSSELDGEWSMVSGSANGAALPESMLKTGKRISKDGVTTISLNGRLFFKAKYALDTSKKPAAIDYDMVEGPTTGQKQLGIYRLDVDTVTFCFSSPGNPRPTEFTSKSGSGWTLSVWKREKK